jgi:hypothetical protein
MAASRRASDRKGAGPREPCGDILRCWCPIGGAAHYSLRRDDSDFVVFREIARCCDDRDLNLHHNRYQRTRFPPNGHTSGPNRPIYLMMLPTLHCCPIYNCAKHRLAKALYESQTNQFVETNMRNYRQCLMLGAVVGIAQKKYVPGASDREIKNREHHAL